MIYVSYISYIIYTYLIYSLFSNKIPPEPSLLQGKRSYMFQPWTLSSMSTFLLYWSSEVDTVLHMCPQR